MFAPVFEIAKDSAGVIALLKTGTGPVRFFPFGEAPQAVAKPYAVFQTAYGSPDNVLSCQPSMDTWGVQVDAYATTVKQSRDVAQALINAFELAGISDPDTAVQVVNYNGEFIDEDTNLRRFSFTVEFMAQR